MSESETTAVRRTSRISLKGLSVEEKLKRMKGSLMFGREDLAKIEAEIAALQEANKDKLDVEARMKDLENKIEALEEVVESMNDKDLEELSKYKNPPERIRFFLEGMFYLLKERKLEWDQIKKEMISGDLKKQIKIFKGKKVKPEVQKNMIKNYTSSPEWDLKKLKNASKVMGPFGDWMENELEYLKTQNVLEPQLKELAAYKEKEAALMKEKERLAADIEALSKDIYRLENTPEEIPKVEYPISPPQALLLRPRVEPPAPPPKPRPEMDANRWRILDQSHVEVHKEAPPPKPVMAEAASLTEQFSDHTFMQRTKAVGGEDGPSAPSADAQSGVEKANAATEFSRKNIPADLPPVDGDTGDHRANAGTSFSYKTLPGLAHLSLLPGQNAGGDGQGGAASTHEAGVGNRENQLVGLAFATGIGGGMAGSNSNRIGGRVTEIKANSSGGGHAGTDANGRSGDLAASNADQIGGGLATSNVGRNGGSLTGANASDLGQHQAGFFGGVEVAGLSDRTLEMLRVPSNRDAGVGSRENQLVGASSHHIAGGKMEEREKSASRDGGRVDPFGSEASRRDAAAGSRENQLTGSSTAFITGVSQRTASGSDDLSKLCGPVHVLTQTDELPAPAPPPPAQVSAEQGIQAAERVDQYTQAWTTFSDKQVQAQFDSDRNLARFLKASASTLRADNESYVVELVVATHAGEHRILLTGHFADPGRFGLEWKQTAPDTLSLLDVQMQDLRPVTIRGRGPPREMVSGSQLSGSSSGSRRLHTCKKHHSLEHSQFFIDLLNRPHK